nr:MAG TPA: hypothetical protein [Caudoviricetes sp.]
MAEFKKNLKIYKSGRELNLPSVVLYLYITAILGIFLN